MGKEGMEVKTQNAIGAMINNVLVDFANNTVSEKDNAKGSEVTFQSVMDGQMEKGISVSKESDNKVKSDFSDTGETKEIEFVSQEQNSKVEAAAQGNEMDCDKSEELEILLPDQPEEQEVELPQQEMMAAFAWQEEVLVQVADELEITPEQLEEFMEQLGLQVCDLQNVQNVQDLVLVAEGTSDRMLLLTDEKLSTTVENISTDITQITEVIAEEFQIQGDDFTKVQNQNAEVLELTKTDETEVKGIVENLSEDGSVVEEKVQSATVQPVVEEQALESMELPNEEVLDSKELPQEQHENLEVVKMKVEQVKSVGVEETQEPKKFESTIENGKKIILEKETIPVEAQPKKEYNTSDGNNQSETSFFEQFLNHLAAEKTIEVDGVDAKVAVVEQMHEIVNQVVEQIKVIVKPDTSAMEIQLNPENLGKVNVSIVAKEGHITAQFVTESELARHALEGQIQQLRETLGSQGLKVDEVEVTVSNFDFSQSNQANAEEQKEQHREQQRKVTRNLHVNRMEAMDELTEAEQIAVAIMKENGNQVDYTA